MCSPGIKIYFLRCYRCAVSFICSEFWKVEEKISTELKTKKQTNKTNNRVSSAFSYRNIASFEGGVLVTEPKIIYYE